MPSRGRSVAGGRAVLVLAVVGLLVLGVVGVAIVGSRPAVVPPGETPSPTPTAVVSPSPTGIATPIEVAIVDFNGADVTAQVDDSSALLAGATSAQPSDGGVVPFGELAITNDSPTRLRLEWTDGPCSERTPYRVTIDAAAAAIAVVRDACAGDAIAVDRILVLEFVRPIDAATVTGTVDLPTAGG